MPTPKRTRLGRASHGPEGHRHRKADCLKLLRHLSAYMEQDLPGDTCDQIRMHLGDCPNCEVFLDSLRQTVALCRQVAAKPLSRTAKDRLRREILNTARS